MAQPSLNAEPAAPGPSWTAVVAALDQMRRLHDSTGLVDRMREAGRVVSEQPVAELMCQVLIARNIRRRAALPRRTSLPRGLLTLLPPGFTASGPNARWLGSSRWQPRTPAVPPRLSLGP